MSASTARRKTRAKPADAGLSLADRAYRQIEEMIVTRALAPGTMISEKQLGEELDCGRTPIREALQRLKVEGYVDILPSRGAIVAQVDVMTQLDLLEVRRPLEELAVRFAAARATPEQRDEIRAFTKTLTAAADAEDRKRFLQVNRGWQEVLQNAGQNAVLAKTLRLLHGMSRRFWYSTVAGSEHLKRASKLHCTTMLAVADGDAERAAAAAADFLNYLESLTRDLLNRRAPM